MKNIKMLLPVLLFLLGTAILAYPAVSGYVNRQNGFYVIEELTWQLADADGEAAETQRAHAWEYNALMAQGEEEADNVSMGVMGAMQIPDVHVNLPIYRSVSGEVLAKGVGHMPGSAFLLTASPYGVNAHRLLVMGERSEMPQTLEVTPASEPEAAAVPWNWIAIGSGVVFLISVGLLVWLLRRRKRT